MAKGAKILVAISALVIVVVLIPLFFIGYETTIVPVTSSYRPQALEVTIANTLEYAGLGAIFSTALAFGYAWLLSRTDIPFKRFFGLMVLVSFMIPALVRAIMYVFLLGRGGLLNVIYNIIFHTDTGFFNIYSMQGMIFVWSFGSLAVGYLIFRPALDAVDPFLEESARVAGARPTLLFRRVLGPLLLPAVASSFLLNLVGALNVFDYPLILGVSAGIRTLQTEIYFFTSATVPPDYASALLLSLVYVAITAAVVVIAAWVTRHQRRFVVVYGKAGAKTVRKLGKWKIVGIAYCLMLLAFNFFLPVGMILLMSFSNQVDFAANTISISFTTSNYATAMNLPLFWPAFLNSLYFSFSSGIIATILGVLVAYSALKSKVKGSRLLEHATNIPLAIPAIVYSFAVFLSLLFLPGISRLYGTLWPLVFASTFLRLPYTVRFVSPNLVQISGELEESARVCGAGLIMTFRRVITPLLMGSLVSSFIFVFLEAFKDLGAVALLSTGNPGSVVLMTMLLTLLQGQSQSIWYVGAASVFILIVTAILIALLQLVNRGALAQFRRGPG